MKYTTTIPKTRSKPTVSKGDLLPLVIFYLVPFVKIEYARSVIIIEFYMKLVIFVFDRKVAVILVINRTYLFYTLHLHADFLI